MKQLLELEFVLYNNNSMKTGDWVPLKLGGGPKKIKRTPEDLKALCENILSKYLTDQFYEDIITKYCNGDLSKKYLNVFLQQVPKILGSNEELSKELNSQDIKWKDISKIVSDAARAYFVNKSNKV